jgi:hypothetical protein
VDIQISFGIWWLSQQEQKKTFITFRLFLLRSISFSWIFFSSLKTDWNNIFNNVLKPWYNVVSFRLKLNLTKPTQTVIKSLYPERDHCMHTGKWVAQLSLLALSTAEDAYYIHTLYLTAKWRDVDNSKRPCWLMSIHLYCQSISQFW